MVASDEGKSIALKLLRLEVVLALNHENTTQVEEHRSILTPWMLHLINISRAWFPFAKISAMIHKIS